MTKQAVFSSLERDILLNLIEKYNFSICNRKTDSRSNAEKDEAWERIQQEFNANSFVIKVG